MGKSGSTVRHAHSVLLQILEVAVTDGLIVSNPARGVRLPRRNAPVKVFLTPAQLAALAKATGDETGDHAIIVWVLGTVGLRWGELAGLKVEDIDFERARIMVRRSVTYVGGRSLWSLHRRHMSGVRYQCLFLCVGCSGGSVRGRLRGRGFLSATMDSR
ncbi:hypothetical protein HO111_05070 [Corynebacterium ulcerans]|uniref:tyrosine-type recombinase/integrase n=1 Tax=Corynebacterium silvaticum TaxID=2320431 RepID=UPI00148F32F9|nr:hypothetical protein [Corynebacterium silvaticum]NON70038.1 hypothetical protein [Corynebacterium silvaticum]